MPAPEVVDEVVSTRANGGSLRPVINETVTEQGASARVSDGLKEETTGEGGIVGRKFKPSTIALFDALEGKAPAAKPAKGAAPAAHEVGDADEDEPKDEAPAAAHEEGDADEGEAPAEGEAEGETTEEETTDEPPAELEVLRTEKTRLEQTNKQLVAQLDAARKTPVRERTPREKALLEAEAAYVDEGSVPALRKFLATVIGAAPDSAQVDEELAGLYADLTAKELNVPLDQSQQAMRKASRAQLALARDKREKAESEKKPVDDNDAVARQQIEGAARVIDNELVTKGQAGTSLADEFPKLMSLAQDFDGMPPSQVLATAIRRELLAGSLDPNAPNSVNIRAVAQKIEAHYEAVAKKISASLAPKTDTTKGTSKQAPTNATNKPQSGANGQGARTISQANAGKAPGTAPKIKAKNTSVAEKSRKDFKSENEWRNYLFDKHQLSK